MDLLEVSDIARKLLKKHNVKDWTFKYQTLAEMNTKGKYVLGRCDYAMKDIILCRELTQHETNIDRIRNTILHEIAHAIDYTQRGTKSGHDKNWTKIAKSIGCSGNKCGDTSNVSLAGFAKWIGKCPKCNKKYYKMVKPKTRMSCGKCGGKGVFDTKYIIDYTLNPRVVKTYEGFVSDTKHFLWDTRAKLGKWYDQKQKSKQVPITEKEMEQIRYTLNVASDEGIQVIIYDQEWKQYMNREVPEGEFDEEEFRKNVSLHLEVNLRRNGYDQKQFCNVIQEVYDKLALIDLKIRVQTMYFGFGEDTTLVGSELVQEMPNPDRPMFSTTFIIKSFDDKYES